MNKFYCKDCKYLSMTSKNRFCLVYNCKLKFFETRIDIPKRVPRKCLIDESIKRR